MTVVGRQRAFDVADAGRVIAGHARAGIRLAAPGEGTRPIGDRVKQTLFAILDPDLPGRRVLDLFAGSGAAGIEALSRGAAHATFVERDAGAAAVIAGEPRAGTPRTPDRSRSYAPRRSAGCGDADAQPGAPFDIVIVDPPYDETDLLAASLEPRSSRSSRPGARVVAKHFWRDRPPAAVGLLASERERRFGETALTFYRRQEDR